MMRWLRGLARSARRRLGLGAVNLHSDSRSELGRFGEDAACSHIRKQGFRIIDRNVQMRNGEIDILAEHPDGTLVVVEVKTRRRDDWRGEWAIHEKKKRQLRRLTQVLGKRQRWHGRRLRIDVIVVVVRDGSVDDLRHHVSAVTLNG